MKYWLGLVKMWTEHHGISNWRKFLFSPSFILAVGGIIGAILMTGLGRWISLASISIAVLLEVGLFLFILPAKKWEMDISDLNMKAEAEKSLLKNKMETVAKALKDELAQEQNNHLDTKKKLKDSQDDVWKLLCSLFPASTEATWVMTDEKLLDSEVIFKVTFTNPCDLKFVVENPKVVFETLLPEATIDGIGEANRGSQQITIRQKVGWREYGTVKTFSGQMTATIQIEDTGVHGNWSRLLQAPLILGRPHERT